MVVGYSMEVATCIVLRCLDNNSFQTENVNFLLVQQGVSVNENVVVISITISLEFFCH